MAGSNPPASSDTLFIQASSVASGDAGLTDKAWTDPGDARFNGGGEATCAITMDEANQSELLRLLQPTWSPALPTTIRIVGYTILVEGYDPTYPNVVIKRAYLYANGRVGDNLSSNNSLATTTGQVIPMGANNDLFGTTLTRADLVATTFGCEVQCRGPELHKIWTSQFRATKADVFTPDISVGEWVTDQNLETSAQYVGFQWEDWPGFPPPIALTRLILRNRQGLPWQTPASGFTPLYRGTQPFQLSQLLGVVESNDRYQLPPNDGTYVGVDEQDIGGAMDARVDQIRVRSHYYEQFTLTLNTSGNGSASATPPEAEGFTTYDKDEVTTLTAVPDMGYDFTGWSGDASGSDNPLSVTMDADKTITANFAATASPVEVQVSFLHLDGGNATIEVRNENNPSNIQLISGTTTITVTEGDVLRFRAIPDPGDEFMWWDTDRLGDFTTNPFTWTASTDAPTPDFEVSGRFRNIPAPPSPPSTTNTLRRPLRREPWGFRNFAHRFKELS